MISEFTTTNTGASQASSKNRLRYGLSEQTGTAVLFVSPSGSLVESNRVYPYGEKWMADYGTSNDQKFTTYTRQNDHYTDEVDYAMTRYYFYSHAVFMSPDRLPGDPADPQSWNRYTYGLNDPVDNIDPSGEECRPDGFDENGNACIAVNVTGSAPSPPPGLPPEQLEQYCSFFPAACGRSGGTSTSIPELVGEVVNRSLEFITTPRDPGCLAASGATGIAAGAFGGAALGLAGGPGAAITVPIGTLGGSILGGIGGYGFGIINCMSSAGGPRGSGRSGAAGHKYAGKTVREILKSKKASIKNAPLPPGSPTWESILDKTWEQIDSAARRGETGYDTIRKLLTDARFDK